MIYLTLCHERNYESRFFQFARMNKRMTIMLIRLRGCAGWSAPLLFSPSTLILPTANQHHRISRLRPIVLVPVTAVANIANFLVDGVAPSSSSFVSSQAQTV